MTLATLQSEMIQAMKSKDKPRKAVISGMIDAVKKAAIDKNCRDNIPESLVDEVLLKYKKLVREQIDTCPAERVELLENYKYQMAVVMEFAPTLITDEDEIERLIFMYADSTHLPLIKSNRGQVMKLATANLKGKADMGVVSRVVGGMLR